MSSSKGPAPGRPRPPGRPDAEEESPPDLLIRLTRRPDGAVVLTCLRADGSSTWQRGDGPTARFFAYHDLTHYAVETVLRHRRGFYGLVAEGWDLTDFGTPWPRGPIPADADPSELIVGLLDGERASGQSSTAAGFNAAAATICATHGVGARWPKLAETDLDCIRAARDALFARWDALPVGEVLELPFRLSD